MDNSEEFSLIDDNEIKDDFEKERQNINDQK